MAVVPFPERHPDTPPSRQPDGSTFDASASIHPLHPPETEGVFDPGAKYPFYGEVQVGREKVEWTVVIPENRIYDGLGIYVPGYMGVKQTSRAPRDAAVDEGIGMASYSPGRRSGSLWGDMREPQKFHAQTIRAVARDIGSRSDIKRQAPNARDINFERLLLPAHSMGGLAAARYADYEPQTVDIIANLAACGYGHPTLLELLADVPKGIPAGIIHELAPTIRTGDIQAGLRNVRDLIRYYRSARTILEGNSCLREDVRPHIAAARKAGVYVAYLGFEHDILVRNDASIGNHVDHHETLDNAGHLAPMRRAPQVAQWLASIVEKATV